MVESQSSDESRDRALMVALMVHHAQRLTTGCGQGLGSADTDRDDHWTLVAQRTNERALTVTPLIWISCFLA